MISVVREVELESVVREVELERSKENGARRNERKKRKEEGEGDEEVEGDGILDPRFATG